MSAASLIPELVDVIQHGSHDRRALTVQRIAGLFIDGAAQFGDAHVALFDDVLSHLVTEIETKARAELSGRLAPIDNSPPGVIRAFALDHEISVAAPVLAASPRLTEGDLVAIAGTRSQAHLAAIAERPEIGPAVTDVLVRRGDVDVMRQVAGNDGARFSDNSFAALVQRSSDDGVLAERVGLRGDIPPHLFHDLLLRATTVVRQRLIAASSPQTRQRIQDVLDRIAEDVSRGSPRRDFRAAEAKVTAMAEAGSLNETALADFAQDKHYEETVAAIAALCKVPIESADRLLSGDRPDPILILCRASGYGWPTARAIILSRPVVRGGENTSLDAAFANFEKLAPTTAQRVVRFWQVRAPDEAA